MDRATAFAARAPRRGGDLHGPRAPDDGPPGVLGRPPAAHGSTARRLGLLARLRRRGPSCAASMPLSMTGCNWPLRRGTAYFGPWAMRHEQADHPVRRPLGRTAGELDSASPSAGSRPPARPRVDPPAARPAHLHADERLRVPVRELPGPAGRPSRARPARCGSRWRSPLPPDDARRGVPRARQHHLRPLQLRPGQLRPVRAQGGCAPRRAGSRSTCGVIPREWPRLVSTGATVAGTYGSALFHRSGLPAEEWRVRGTVDP